MPPSASMIRYFQWVSIAGVWGVIAALAFGFALAALLPAEIGGGMLILLVILAFAAAHGLAVAALIGLLLLATGRAERVVATVISVVAGGLFALPVLARIYFDGR